MLARIVSKLILLVTPFLLAIFSLNDMLANALNPPEPIPITLTEITGKVQKLSLQEGMFQDVTVGEVVELNEQVLTHQDSVTRIDLMDNWAIQMEPLSAITIEEMNQEENGLHTRVRFDIGVVDVSVSSGTFDVETPSGLVSLHAPARAYLKVKMNSGETWASCMSGDCSLEKEGREIALRPGQMVTFSQFANLPSSPEGGSPAFPSPTHLFLEATTTPADSPTGNPANTDGCDPPIDWVIHIVQAGETLEYLSLIYQVPIEALKQANCLKNTAMVVTGYALFVPNIPPLSTSTPIPTGNSLTNIPQAIATKTTNHTATKTSVPKGKNTPVPTATKTPAPEATNTPKPTSTNTPASYPTDTSKPSPTNTGQPTATNTATPTATDTPPPTPTNTSPPPAPNVYYLDVNNGSDSNPGTLEKPWQTMIKAFRSLHAGDTLYMRQGVYITEWRSGRFEYSGTAEQPITVTNYPSEKVEIRVTSNKGVGWEAFMCWADAEASTPKVDYVRIIGTGGGFLVRGTVGQSIETAGIWGAGNCDHWEVAGLTFEDLGYGIFTKKLTYSTIYDYSPDNWYVHGNKVSNYYSESGMQFNGNYNVIEDNEIYKVANVSNQGYGCQMLNLLGHHNIVRGNTLSGQGSDYDCLGILFEWDIADESIVEYNTIMDVGFGGDGAVLVAGGDNNIIRYNTVHATSPDWFAIYPNDSGTDWPCNDAASITPADDPRAADYPYFYPHDCKSVGNQVYDNTYIGP